MESSATKARLFSRVHVVIALVMLAVVSLMGWTTWSARKLVVTFVPQVNATMEARQAVTEAHLWLEEIVSGDSGEQASQVWDRIALARGYLDAMIEGREGVEDAIPAVESAVLRDDIVKARAGLQQFEHIARARVGGTDSGVGSALDEQFDRSYEEFYAATISVEEHLDVVIAEALREFLLMQAALILSVIALFSWVIWLLLRKEALERDAHMQKLRESFDEVSRSRQELERQNALRGALVEMGDRMQGLEHPEEIAVTGLRTLCEKTGANVGAFWLCRPGAGLRRLAGHSLPEDRHALVELDEGEGLVGQVAINRQALAIDMPAGYLKVASGLGQASPAHVRILPLVHDGASVGVLELAFLALPDADAVALVEAALPALAIRLHLAARQSARLVA